MQRECKKHGLTKHLQRADSGWRCSKCATEAVTRRIRKVKATLVAEAGGKCVKCGYSRCQRALQFHHRDRREKAFGLSGGSISIDRQRSEAAKCDLVCANCHAEIEEARFLQGRSSEARATDF